MPGPRFAKLTLFLMALVTYGVTLGNGFVWDDSYIIVNNPATRSLASIQDLLFSPDVVKPYYRPLNRVSYVLDHFLFGMNPIGFHAVNVLLHAANGVLVFLLGKRLFSTPAAFLAALVFVLHPINVESVALISARNNLLALFFSLSCLLAIFKGSRRASWAWYPLAALLFFLGLMSKETAFMTLALVGVYVIWPFGHGTEPLRRRVLPVLACLAAAALYFVLRAQALEGAVGTGLALEDLWSRLALNTYIIPYYLGLFFLPTDLTIYHAVPSGWEHFSWLIPVWLLIIAAGGAIVTWGGAAARFGLLWLAVFYLPVSGLVPIPSAQIAERFMYLPIVGLCLALAAVAMPLLDRLPGKSYRVLLVCALTGVLTFLSVERSRDWKDDVTLFASAIREHPFSVSGYYNLGSAYLERGDLDKARAAWERVIYLDGTHSGALTQLGTLEAVQGNFGQAEKLYHAALQTESGNIMARYNLGKIYERKGLPAQALAQYLAIPLPLPVEYSGYQPDIQARIAHLQATR